MIVRQSTAFRTLRAWSKRIPWARAIYRAATGAIDPVMRRLNAQNLRILEGFPAFATSSAGSYKVRADLTMQAADQMFPFLKEFLHITGHEVRPLIELRQFSSDERAMTAASKLRLLFDRHGSDKGMYGYHLIYGPILVHAGEIEAILEVGLGTNNLDVPSNMGYDGKPGASLRALRDYLPRAHVFGADVDRRVLFAEERITTFFVDQTNLETVRALGRQLPELDLVIDDGLHSPNANIAVLMLAITKLKEGGWVVIEDIVPSALPIWQVVASMMPKNFESSLIRTGGGMVFVARRTA
jgi:SAM-dependent methyltransferase